MGYLADTTHPLNFEQTKALARYIKEHGIIQFLNLYKKFKDHQEDHICWGDELELHLLNIDPSTKLPRLQLNTDYIFNTLTSDLFTLQPEYGAWMLEAVPTKPYEFTGDPQIILENFQARRNTIKSCCKEGDVLFSGTVFPLLKVGDFFVPRTRENANISLQIPEEEKNTVTVNAKQVSPLGPNFKYELLNPHPRYAVSCENIRLRRGELVKMLVPIYKDEKTELDKPTKEEPFPGFIHMDEGLFGTGNTSLQVTFGTRNLDEARYLTDQMSVLSSIVLPMSAACAVFKGKLADTDVRWDVLCNSVDCRSQEERDPSSSRYRPKPRWSSISRYISDRKQCKEEYNDVAFPLDKEMMKLAEDKAKEMGIELDERMKSHLGFLFLQDPLIIYGDKVFVDDETNTNHFENLQSTNWNNVRFKPPPGFDSEIGWRVELRTIEAQLTAEECVAFCMLSYFMAEMIIKREYNLYIPISKVDENFTRAQVRNAILTQKFWFRKDIQKDSPDEYIELSLDEILHGKQDHFIGLLNLIYDFCKEEYGVDIQAEWAKKQEDSAFEANPLAENMKYFEILSKRVKGESPTIAAWIRNFVMKHPKYEKNSIVNAEIAGDLITAMTAISDNEKTYEDFM